MAMKLTDKETKFINELLKPDVSQREAYKRSYNAENMSDATIDVKACNLLKKDKIRVRYEQMRQRLEQKAQEEGLLSATDVLKGIADLYYRNKGEDDKVALDALKTYGKHHALFTDKVEHSGEIKLPQIKIVRK